MFIFTFHVVEIEGNLNPFPTFSRKKLYEKEFSYILYNIGAVYYEKKDYQNAINFLKALLTINKDYKRAYYILGKIYLKQKDYEKAKIYLEKAKKLGMNK